MLYDVPPRRDSNLLLTVHPTATHLVFRPLLQEIPLRCKLRRPQSQVRDNYHDKITILNPVFQATSESVACSKLDRGNVR